AATAAPHRFVRVRNARRASGAEPGVARGARAPPRWPACRTPSSIANGFAYDDDSDSWMSLADLFEELLRADMCAGVHKPVVAVHEEHWHEAVFRGSWTEWLSGGCLEKAPRPLTNPHLSQRFEATPHDLVSMGLLLVKVESNREYRAHGCAPHSLLECAANHSGDCTWRPGRYILLPCTEIASQEAFFTLRIYSRGASCNARELVADQPPASLCFAFTAYPEVGTRVLVLSARGLPRLVLGANPYCQVFFEGGGVQGSNAGPSPTPQIRNGTSALVFYRRTDQRVISFEIRSERAVVDAFFGARPKIDQDEWFKGGDGVQELQLYGHRQDLPAPGLPCGRIRRESSPGCQ
uniref:Calpain_III domain-containing protein n=1 Tax=Macrostomum lignano TaxID=282301 RepID=A0A1I8F506_9PLAT